ncbi:carotenoid oxygenase family protein [soil metagenome]
MNRRAFLTASAALTATLASPEAVHAAAAALAAGDWTLAVKDLEADVPRAPMRLVQGRAPAALSGTLFRNGPAKFHRPGGSATHWFDGDGMVRSFRIADGKASLAARFVDTPKRRQETEARAVLTPGFGTPMRAGAKVDSADSANAANTSVLHVGNEIWALWEAGSPTAIDPVTLETKCARTLRPDLAHMPFLAHPRVETGGRIWNLGLAGTNAFVWRLAADGSLEAGEVIPLPAASYVHDFTATDRHLVIVLQPWVSRGGSQAFVSSLDWKPGGGTKVLVVDKADLSKRRIYELPAFFFFHMGDAWAETDGTIRFDICAEPDPAFAIEGARMLLEGKFLPQDATAQLNLVTLRPDGRATMTPVGEAAEFPGGDPRFAGLRRRYSVHTAAPAKGRPMMQGLAVRDWKADRTRSFDYGVKTVAEEAVFVPRPGSSAEFDGWLVAPSLNLNAQATELAVFDALRVDAGPICTWRAEVALPAGFHGKFVTA